MGAVSLVQYMVLLVGALLAGCTSFHTNPIVDAQGRTLPRSVASLERIKLGGVDQWILIRGADIDKPLLLKLHGGPGAAEMATVGMNSLLERDFIVVEWDQRGAGKSADSIEPRNAMTIDQLVADTNELAQLLLKRFNRKTLILVGHSWGSIIGLKAVRQAPQLYRAFVSTGQMVNFAEGQQLTYRHLLEEVGRRNDGDERPRLEKIGPPPYIGDAGAARREEFIKSLETSGGYWRSEKKFDRIGWMMSSVEYAWPEKLRYPRAAEQSFELFLPQLLKVDMIKSVPAVAVPVFFAVGRHDWMAPVSLTQAYFATLVAPRKELIWFEQSAHFPQWEEVEKFHALLTQKVLPATAGN